MADDLSTHNKPQQDVPEMSDEQFEILAATVADVSEALNGVSEELASRIRNQQEDVAETRRLAQVNEDLLRLRVR